jgi:hypothetical protein
MNITQEQRLHIFMLYPNAEIFHTWIPNTSYKWHLDAVFFSEEGKNIRLIDREKQQQTTTWAKDCQLILNDLSQLTEEDKRELTVVLGWNSKQDTTIKYLVSGTYSSPYFQVDTGWTYEKFFIDRLPHPAADHLRKKRYMVPVYIEGQMIDLFESGVAVQQQS